MKTVEENDLKFFELKNKNGFTVQLLNYGAGITKILAPKTENKKKIFENVVLGFEEKSDYLKHYGYYGSTVGRVCNRISKGKFTLNSKEFFLIQNNGNNCLHGGKVGFDKKLWSSYLDEKSVKFSLFSSDGDENFPGNVQVSVEYSISEENEIIMEYKAESDQDTIINLTNHSFFNLNGVNNDENILNHELKLNSGFFTPVNDQLIPTGEIENTERKMNFREPKRIGKDINEFEHGYDHNFVIDGYSKNQLNFVAEVFEPNSKRKLKVFSTEPGVQFYTGNYLNGEESGDKKWTKHFAFCLECQHFPDSINQPKFPSIILKKGEVYYQKTIYQFLH
eukprot:gene9428-1635_t